MTTTLNKTPNSQLTRAIRLLLYLVLIGIALYQFSKKAREAPVEAPEKEPPRISYVPPEELDTKSEDESPLQRPLDNTSSTIVKPAEKPITLPDSKTVPKLENKPAENKTPIRGKIRTQIDKQTIRDQSGNVIFSGTIDLSETIARIQRGQELTQFRHDGIVFENRERRLPQHGPGYYREWVHPTPDERGPGPQRVITGENGEFWYTANHYKSFIRLN